MQNDTFKDFVLDQLRDMGRVECRRMFGGYGLYYGKIFFGIIYKGQLYLKTGPTTRGAYEQRGMQPFRPSPKQTLKNYYETPAEILDDDEQLVAWAHAAAGSEY